MIEPINTVDMPGYFLHRLDDASAFLRAAPAPKPSLQFDFYHLQIIGGDLIRNFERYLGEVGHVQIAGVPGRNEPDTGEVNYPFVFRELDRLGYAGWVGCEYRPARAGAGGTSAGLGWLRRL
jgi:hydroxypyruvate isomerase